MLAIGSSSNSSSCSGSMWSRVLAEPETDANNKRRRQAGRQAGSATNIARPCCIAAASTLREG